MKVSVIIPTLNEAGNIENVLKAIPKDEVDELLVVDGGSTDDTIEIVRRLGYPLIIQDKPGLGRAVNLGLRNTDGDVKIVLDADGSHDPADIPKIVKKIREGFDLVIASRYISGPTFRGLFKPIGKSSSHDDTLVREIGNRLFTWLCRKIHGVPVYDVLMGYKGFRSKIFDKIKIDATGQEYDAEVLIRAKKAGFKLGEIPTIEHRRLYGTSKLSVPYHGFKILWVIIRESTPNYKRK